MADPTHLPIRYIGTDDTYVDTLYKTGIGWSRGMTQMVPIAAARKMLEHKDVFVEETLVTGYPIIVSSAAPSNGDGRPDGTIYIQTAS